MRSRGRLVSLAVALAAAVAVPAFAQGCATGGATDPGPDDEEDAGVRVDAGRLPDPVKTDGGPLVPKPVDRDGGADGGGQVDAGDACAAALAGISFVFESGPQGWTHGVSDNAAAQASWPFDGWTQGAASRGTACRAGSCFGCELGRNYAQCQRGFLLSPAIDLRACAGRNVALVFQHAYAFWSNGTSFDGGVVEVSTDGQTWQVPTAPGVYSGTVAIRGSSGGYSCVLQNGFGVNGKQGFVGKKPTTEKMSIPLPAAVISATTRVRFSMASGVSSLTNVADDSRTATDFGWRIDDVGFELR